MLWCYIVLTEGHYSLVRIASWFAGRKNAQSASVFRNANWLILSNWLKDKNWPRLYHRTSLSMFWFRENFRHSFLDRYPRFMNRILCPDVCLIIICIKSVWLWIRYLRNIYRLNWIVEGQGQWQGYIASFSFWEKETENWP